MQEKNNSMTWIIAVVVIIVVAVVAFLLLNEGDDANNDDTDDTMTQDENDEFEIEASPVSFTLSEQNDSGQSGTVVFEPNGSQTQVTISLSSPTTTPEPAHIHTGACPDPGGVVYPLNDVVNGESVTTLNVSLDELESMVPLAVNVHKSAAESSVYFSCGNLNF